MYIFKSIANIGAFTAAAVIGALGVVMMFSLPEAKAATEVEEQINEDFSKYFQSQKIKFNFNLTEAKLSSIAVDWAKLKIGMEVNKNTSNHSESIIDQEFKKIGCDVQVSAQSGDKNRLTGDLLTSLKKEDVFWRSIMVHEVAHCIRNPYRTIKPKMENSDLVRFEPALMYLSESYSDSFALVYQWSKSKEDAQLLNEQLQKWRSGISVAPMWRTAETLKIVSKDLEGIQTKTPLSIEQMDKLAWNASIKAIQTPKVMQISAIRTTDIGRFISLIDKSI